MENSPAIEKSGIKGEVTQYLSFTVGNDAYGIDVSQIREVIEYNNIIHLTRIPLVHESILGVINLRGELIPVVDLSMRLYNRRFKITERTCIVIADIADANKRTTVGAMIDAVKGVININGNDIIAAPDFGTKIRPGFINKIGNLNDVFIVLLDINELLNTDELSDLAVIDADVSELLSMKAVKEDELRFSRDSSEKDEPHKESAGEHDFITFAAGDEMYAIDILYIREIIKVNKMSNVPNALPFMKGVINFRDKVVPVVDMRERCNLGTRERNKKIYILIIELNDLLIGLMVDSFRDVVRFPVNKIQYPPHYSAKIDSDFINGLIQSDEGIIIILNINKILSPEEHDLINKQKLF